MLLEKEIAEILRNRAFLISVITQIFMIFVLLFMYKTYSNIDHYNIPITVAVNSNDTTMINALKQSGVNVVVKNSSSTPNTNTNPIQTNQTFQNQVAEIDLENKTIKTDSSNILSSIAIARIKVASKIKSFEEVLQDNNYTFQVQGNTKKNEFAQIAYSLIVPLIVLFPAIVSMTLASESLLLEKKKKTIELLLVSPVSNLYILIVKLVPLVIFGVLTSLILILFASSQIEILNQHVLLVIALIMNVIATSLGIIISTKSKTVREANAISAIIAIIIVSFIVISNPFSIYFPHTIAARVSITNIDSAIIQGIIINIIFAIMISFLAYKSIESMRTNYY
ncbi:MAG: ABC transporter permease [Candidatus Micrarchaeota archaeon]|nr:ABC transporter permease [Candidatus Micrarchaeota archaeon]